MKKIMILLALLSAMQIANAQKSAEAVNKAINAAKAACNDPKKAAKVGTWLSLAKASEEAYTAPQLQGLVGSGRNEVQMLNGNAKVLSTSEETLNGTNYIVDHYASCDYYYSEAQVLQMIVVTTPYVENPLETALYAYENASKNDPKGSKTKDIREGIKKVAEFYQNDAISAYQMGKLEAASELFQKSADARATSPLSEIDSASVYNSGLTAFMAGNYEAAKAKMQACVKIDYLESGEVYAKLAESYKKLGDTLACKNTLEEGFAKCPDNQGILVGLINLYLDTNDDPEKLFSLLDIAKKNEPTNASLYYVEGNIRKQLGQNEKAYEAYEKCAQVNPAYEFGYIGSGLLHWETAVKIQEEAEKEFNDRKYQALVEKFDAELEAAIPCFEKAFDTTVENATKVALAEYLKNIYFRFRDKDASYQAAYDKYNSIVKENN